MSEKPKLLKGKVTISRVNVVGGEDNRQYISINLIDELSGCECCDIQIPVEKFGELVTGLGHVDCEFEWRPQNVGKKREHKIETIPFKTSTHHREIREKEAIEALKPYEIDGWKGSWRDLCNMHRKTKDGYNVSFIRFVDINDN